MKRLGSGGLKSFLTGKQENLEQENVKTWAQGGDRYDFFEGFLERRTLIRSFLFSIIPDAKAQNPGLSGFISLALLNSPVLHSPVFLLKKDARPRRALTFTFSCSKFSCFPVKKDLKLPEPKFLHFPVLNFPVFLLKKTLSYPSPIFYIFLFEILLFSCFKKLSHHRRTFQTFTRSSYRVRLIGQASLSNEPSSSSSSPLSSCGKKSIPVRASTLSMEQA